MKKVVTFMIWSFFTGSLIAQPDITPFQGSAQEAAEYLVGPGVVVEAAAFIGAVSQCATFTEGSSSVGFEEGIMLANGNSIFAECVTGCSTENNAAGSSDESDPNISGDQHNLASLEFTFTSYSTTLQFDFVFASMEYSYYVGTGYNDKFVFILNEEQADGTFINIGNIARLPNGTVVSINTVNNGSTNVNHLDFIPQNPEYFTVNSGWVYTGQTTVIPIHQTIKCNTRYKLRLAIADIGDEARDAAIFFKKGSWQPPFSFGDLTAGPLTVCEGSPVTLTVDGSNELNYVWSNGQQGIGLKSISVPAALGVTSYTVTAFNPDGCEYHGTSNNIIIHPSNNQPPEIDGVTTFGGFEITVREGLEAYFEVPTYDNPEEGVTFHWLNMFDGPTYGKFYNEYYNIIHEAGSFSWAPQQTGVYQVQVYAQDLNVCQSLPSIVHTIKINVVCAYCDYEITYANRSPTNNPLPHITEAVHFIEAGFDGPVVVGTDEVIFRAPNVYLEDMFGGFISGAEFQAETTPICSTAYCNDCCSENIFIPPVPEDLMYIFSPDGDGYLDYWYFPDYTNPGCAWNAQSFELYITNRNGGQQIYQWIDHDDSNNDQCCRYQSPPSQSTSEHSSIFWDGSINSGFLPTSPWAMSGWYNATIKLWGCSGYYETQYDFELFVDGNDGQRLAGPSSPVNDPAHSQIPHIADLELRGYPNPGKDFYTMRWMNMRSEENAPTNYQLYDMTGRLVLSGQFQGLSEQIDISHLSKGIYNCVALRSGNQKTLKFLKE